MKVLRDAVHGDIWFEGWEVALFDTWPLQRLRGIRQLGTSYLVYPSATHTRFEHSLGTAWLTKRILDILVAQGERIEEEARRAAIAAGLLHDVTHVPFGHTFEDERRLWPRHDEDKERLAYFLEQPDLRRVLRREGLARAVWEVLAKEGHTLPPFVGEVVAGTICADLLDYLRRDAYFCGLAQQYDDRLLRFFALERGHLILRLHKDGTFRHDALSELLHLLRMRYHLTERVYYHHAKVVAGAMVSRALELALRAGLLQPQELYSLQDESFLYLLHERGAQVPGVRELVEDLWSRRLYKRVYFLTLEQPGRPGIPLEAQRELVERYHFNRQGAREEAERRLARRLRLPEHAVILYCPSPQMALKEAEVLVQWSPHRPAGPLAELGQPDVAQLQQRHRHLWRFYVCLRRDALERAERAGELCEELFGWPNLLPLQRKGQLALEFD